MVDTIWNPKTIVGFILLELVRKSLHLVSDNVDYCIAVNEDEEEENLYVAQ